MTHFNSRNSFVMAAAVAGIVLGGAANAQTSIRVASFTPEGAVGVQNVMIPWMDAVQEELGDSVEMIPFWGGALGPSPFEQYDLVRDGVVDVAWVLPGYTPGQFTQLQVTELPFTVSSAEEASVVGWRLYETGLLGGLDDVHVLTVWAPDVTNIHLTDPVTSLEELDGTSLRTAGATQAIFVDAIGAAPQTLGSTEANEAMGRGTIDGQLQGWTGMNTFGGFAVSNGAYRVPLGASPFLLLMNLDLWESLSAEQQEVMMRHAGEELARAGGQAYDEITLGIIERQREAGYAIAEADEAEIAAYQAAYPDIYDQWVAATENGAEVLAAFQGLIEDYRAETASQ
ncbi:TRAP transporter substrate-binding protein [Jannaschia sp. CCS1]|uniref:TRAP transporter substrate-binding protein n=1 Tax=Jannaschia sp. (strain CCS1) TaxID=290400 RepID=UPI000053D7B4|nr:TRAP transporter substrate-binding protein [Jannaschia sp. CCS1]ABD56689.1 TRAP dicarboxylate transporter- DctP subunit [Jannaschia sp. CCS1]